jgi:protein tyrosine phosphatase
MVQPLIMMIQSVREFTEGYATPWIVHCSAGIGRSGTVVALDRGMHQLTASGRANVVSIIDSMRNYRGGLVQHAEQAQFVHTCLTR